MKLLIQKFSPQFRFHSEKVFGNLLRFSDYVEFTSIFDTIFVCRDYRFHPRTPQPRILDCGSNVGLSLLYFKRDYPNARITAFEPDPATFALLWGNATRNGWNRIQLRNEAVCGSTGIKSFYYDSSRPGNWLMSLKSSCGLLDSEQVVGVRLSDFVDSEFDFLKLDVEGAELEVIEDLSARGKLPLIREMAVEVHPRLLNGSGGFSRLRALLEGAGFRLRIRSQSQQDDNFTIHAERDGACPMPQSAGGAA